MRRQMSQMKKKTPKREQNKMETISLLDAQFKTLVIRILKKHSENFNSMKNDIETMKKNQSEMKYTLVEMNNSQGINSRVSEAENQIFSDLEYKEAKNTQSEQQKEKRIPKYKNSVRSLWNNFKCTKICIMGVPEGEEREQEIENLFEKIITENFPYLVKEIDIQV